MESVKKHPQYDLSMDNGIKGGSVSQGGNKEGDRESEFSTGNSFDPNHINGVWNGPVRGMQDRDKLPSPSGKSYN